jgi:hypothetical protein
LDEDALNSTDIAIICTASYKTSVKISSEKFTNRVVQEIINAENVDSFLLVAFIKTLRHNKIYSPKVIDRLNIIMEEDKTLNYHSLIHILPYISDNSILDIKLINAITLKCLRTFDDEARVKDVQKFLHSCALLNLNLEKSHLLNLERLIVNRVHHVEFKYHFDHYVNATLSLWILNHQSKALVDILLHDKRFYKIGTSDRIKLDSRMKMLHTCIEIERPEWTRRNFFIKSFDEARLSPWYLIKPSLERVMEVEFKDTNAMFVQQIKNMNIAGILVVNDAGKKVHYEVLDEVTCLNDRKTPNGIFQLKLRLLKKLGCDVKILNSFNIKMQ